MTAKPYWPQAPTKSRRGLVVAVVFLVLVAGAVGGYFLLNGDDDDTSAAGPGVTTDAPGSDTTTPRTTVSIPTTVPASSTPPASTPPSSAPATSGPGPVGPVDLKAALLTGIGPGWDAAPADAAITDQLPGLPCETPAPAPEAVIGARYISAESGRRVTHRVAQFPRGGAAAYAKTWMDAAASCTTWLEGQIAFVIIGTEERDLGSGGRALVANLAFSSLEDTRMAWVGLILRGEGVLSHVTVDARIDDFDTITGFDAVLAAADEQLLNAL